MTRCRRSAPSSSPTAAASTARISRASPTARSAIGRWRSPPTARAIPSTIASLAVQIAERFGLHHEIIRTDELERPEYRANPVQPLLLLQARAVHAPDADRRRPPGGRRRRQQRRRSRRLPPRPAGRARVRRAQPARRGQSRQGRDPRAVAPRRAADLGRAGVRLSVVADSVSHRGDRREAADDRARRAGAAQRWAFASAACAITTIWPGSRSGGTRCTRALEAEIGAAIVRELKAIGYRYVTHRSRRVIAPAA